MNKIGAVVYKKLRRRNAYGLVEHGEDTIYIDARLRGQKQLEILLHEGSHILQPYLTEEAVEHIGAELARMLWAQGFRKVDNDKGQPLQDEAPESAP